MPVSTLSGIVSGASVSVTLLGSTSSVLAWAETAQHPSLRNALGFTDYLDGWGKGDHYFHETDADGASLIGPAEEHRSIYVTGNPTTNWSAADIAAEEGIPQSAVTGAWLESQTKYGSQAFPLDRSRAANLLARIAPRPSAGSIHVLLERGHDYGGTSWFRRGASGHSPLHPFVVRDWGTGPKPVVGDQSAFQTPVRNMVLMNLATSAGGNKFYGLTNLLMEGVVFDQHEVEAQGNTSPTFYRCGLLNAIRSQPAQGSATWSDENANRSSGIFADETTGLLMLENYGYHCGWVDGYDTVSHRWENGTYGQPPNLYSHNFYLQGTNKDTTFADNVSLEPASSHVQFRSGGYYWGNVLVNGNIAGNMSGGDAVSGAVIGEGNYTFAADSLAMSAAFLIAGAGAAGPYTSGAANWGWDAGGTGRIGTFEEMLLAHDQDPNNPAEIAFKNTFAPIGETIRLFGNEYRDTSIVYNWATNEGPANANRNVDGLDTAVLNDTTVQRYAETVLGLSNPTIRGFSEHVIAQPAPWEAGRAFLNWTRTRFGLAPVDSSRTANQTVVFSPWPHAEGFRWDNRRNWSTGYFPIDGDRVELASHDVRSPVHTLRLAALNFGTGNRLHVSGGCIGADTVSATGSGATVEITRAGQFRIGGHAAASGLQISVTDGRFFNMGTVTAGISASAAGFAELVLATGAGAFTLAAGETLTLTGGACRCGFDGTDGGAASLTLSGTLTMTAAGGALPQIREFRSGMWGETATNLASTVTCGGTLNVDVTGVAPGTYDLIRADAVAGSFDTVTITGGAGTLAYTATQVRLTVT